MNYQVAPEILKMAGELEIDLEVIFKPQDEIPEGSNLPLPLAQELFVKSWSLITYLTDVITIVKDEIRRIIHIKINRYTAVLKTCEEKTDAGKRRVADSDMKYLEYKDNQARAELFRDFLLNKREDIIKLHYMAKEVKRDNQVDHNITPREEIPVE